jgi:hypothetical protein
MAGSDELMGDLEAEPSVRSGDESGRHAQKIRRLRLLRRQCVLPVRAAAKDRVGAVVADGAVEPW